MSQEFDDNVGNLKDIMNKIVKHDNVRDIKKDVNLVYEWFKKNHENEEARVNALKELDLFKAFTQLLYRKTDLPSSILELILIIVHSYYKDEKSQYFYFSVLFILW
jgi:hypothetical protein